MVSFVPAVKKHIRQPHYQQLKVEGHHAHAVEETSKYSRSYAHAVEETSKYSRSHYDNVAFSPPVHTETMNTLYNVCSVHRGMFSTSGGVQYIGGIP